MRRASEGGQAPALRRDGAEGKRILPEDIKRKLERWGGVTIGRMRRRLPDFSGTKTEGERGV